MIIENGDFSKKQCEYLRQLARQRFEQVRSDWIECGLWAAPYRVKWMLSQVEGARNNRHIVDPTHILALRSFVAGFLEGNTSATRPWYRVGTLDPDVNHYSAHREWLDAFTRRTLNVLTTSNFYHAAGQYYYDYGVFNTGAYYIDETRDGLFFHNLTPGSYYIINNGYGKPVVLVREFSLSVKAVVDTYRRYKNGMADWSNISKVVRKMYEDGNYTETVNIVHIAKENKDFNPELPQALLNRRWISYTYEVGQCGQYGTDAGFAGSAPDPDEEKADVFLKISASKRKPFIVGKSESSNNFEYGEKGPTLDALGLIKSLNKKAIGKDQALEQMLRPAMQGPANLKKSYVSGAAGTFIPLDATSLAQKGMRPIFEVNPAIGTLIQDVTDLRQMVDKIFYADYLLYLSRNPKTRTATETNAIIQEQQLIIGPNLQSLNWTHNVPVVEFAMDYVLFEDPWVMDNPVPEELAGMFLKPDFISVFAQAQKAADLPAVDRYMGMVEQVGQMNPKIWDKVNIDKLADLYEDRLFLPAGLNNPQAKVDAMREQAQAQQQRQQMLHETLPAMAGAAKDVGLKVNQ
jgi:hypothetical protein